MALATDQAERLAETSAALWKEGVEARWVPPAVVPDLEPNVTSKAAGALLIPIHGFVGVSSLTRAAAAAAERHGATLVEGVGAIAVRPAPGGRPPQLLLLAGDTIYADATYGVFDPTAGAERFDQRYFEAWTAPNAQEVLRRLPTYPMLDDRGITPSSQWDVPIWGPERNRFGWRSYLGDRFGTDDVPVYAAPARATDLAGLPPTSISRSLRVEPPASSEPISRTWSTKRRSLPLVRTKKRSR